MLINRMLGINTTVDKTEEFSKAGIYVKTISLNRKGNMEEDMSFPAFEFKSLVKESWVESSLRDLLESTKFFFIIFKEDDCSSIFLGAKFWSMPLKDIDGIVKEAWEEVVGTINNGVELSHNGKSVSNNLLKAAANKIIHVRPHAEKSSYKEGDKNADELPVPAKWTNKPEGFSDKWMTKQSFC